LYENEAPRADNRGDAIGGAISKTRSRYNRWRGRTARLSAGAQLSQQIVVGGAHCAV
jgi:hypothetical protein